MPCNRCPDIQLISFSMQLASVNLIIIAPKGIGCKLVIVGLFTPRIPLNKSRVQTYFPKHGVPNVPPTLFITRAEPRKSQKFCVS